jgi:hypothetical protein
MDTKNVDIRLNSKADLKGFKQAETALTKLNKTTKTFAKSFGLAFGASALVAFSKASVKAFAADEAAARRLSTAVDNLGIGFANPAISKYIADLEKSASIADDLLRPAFQALLTTTGSLTKSQELLSNAIQISRASGIDLVTVADDLAKGFVGTTRGLSKYNSGLTKAELQSKSFNEILGIILAKSAGAAEDYLTTTSYKMDALSIATGNASEIIGGGFVDALARASGGTEASDAAIFLETMAGLFNKITLAAGTSVGAIPTLAQNLKKLGKDIFFGFVGKQAGANLATPPKTTEAKLTLTEKKQQELLAKMEKEALRREKERLALLNKQNAAKRLQGVIDKANLALGKGGNIFDIEAIQINAALIGQAEALGKATTGSQILAIANDVQRLKIKQDIAALEDAIASKDEAAILKATAKLNEDLKILGALQKQDAKLLDINKVLAGMKSVDLINLTNLQDALALLAQFTFPSLCAPTTMKPGTKFLKSGITMIGKTPFVTGSVIDPLASLKTVEDTARATSVLPEYISATEFFTSLTDAQKADLGGYSPGMNTGAGYGAGGTVVVNVNAGAIGDENTIVDAVQNALNEIARRGYTTTYAGAISA